MKITIGYKGWMLFCPVYLPADQEQSEHLQPIPRFGAWWLLNWALACQQAINRVVMLFDEEAGGFLVHAVREIEPREIEVEAEW